jgi:hypothetical protein
MDKTDLGVGKNLRIGVDIMQTFGSSTPERKTILEGPK